MKDMDINKDGKSKGQPGRGSLVFRNTLSRASSATFAQILALATIPLLLNKVSASEFGLYTIGSAFVGYFSLLSIPARSATVKFVAEFGVHDTKKISEFASSTILANLFVGILMSIILFILAYYSQEIFVIQDEYVKKAQLILLLYACIVPFSQPLSVFGSILYGLQDYRPASILDVFVAIIRALTIVMIFMFDGSIIWLVIQELFFEVIKNIILAYLLSSKYGVSGFSLQYVKVSNLKKVLDYGGWSICYVLSTLLIYQGTRILVGVFVSVSAVAYFQIGYMLYNVVNSVSLYLQSAVLPASSSAMKSNDHDFIKKLLTKGTKTSLCILLPLSLCVVMLAEPILTNWISPEYSNDAAYLSKLLVSAWFLQAWIMTSVEVYRGQGDIRLVSVVVMVGAFFQVALAVVLMIYFGVVGAAISVLIYYAIVTPIQLRIISRKLEFSALDFFIKAVMPVYMLMLIVALFSYQLINIFGMPETAIATLAYLVISFFIITILCFLLVARDEGRTIYNKILSIYKKV